ncbi:MAG: glycoside hydrolase family 95 protein, partial [bacterium]|nr:glycoside hydrolase family 95 protein [bacterium]
MLRIALLLAFACPVFAEPLVLWYDKPAANWNEALPVGNGRLGAMVFGRVAEERIQFNEDTVWQGRPHSYVHHGAHRYLGEIRDLLWQGRQAEAELLGMDEFMSVPLRQRAYQAFGDLKLEFPGIDESSATKYRRELDLDTAVATTRFNAGGVTYTREVISSFPHQVIAVRLTADKPGSITCKASLVSAHAGSTVQVLGTDQISLSGAVPRGAIRFEARLLARTSGGEVEASPEGISIEKADSVTLLLAGATNFVNFRDVSGNPRARNEATISSAPSWSNLLRAHTDDHRKLFRRVHLDVGATAVAKLPTNRRIEGFFNGDDPHLVTLTFQYGRYLLIASSRDGGQPANLQGLWNESNEPAWDSKYTVNINTEMNYWPAEPANLAECNAPLFKALAEVAESGAEVAREHYSARGWVLHHNFDLWRGAAPINNSNHGIWPTGGAWLTQHLWWRY